MRSPRCSISTTAVRPDGWIPNKHGGRENIEAIEFLRRINTEVFGAFPAGHHHGRGIDRLADGVAAGRLGRARLRLQVEHGVDARHPRLHRQGSDLPPPSPRQHPVRPALRVLRELHPAAVARRGRARQTLDPRPHAGRRLAALRQPARLLRLHVRASGQEADVHGLRVRARTANGTTTTASTGTCSNSRSIAACSALVRDLNQLYRDTPALHELDCDARASNGWSPTTPTSSVFAWLRKGAEPHERCVVVVNFTPRGPIATIASACRSPALARSAQHRCGDLWRQQCRERRGGLDG